MKYFRTLTLLFIAFFIVACNQEPSKPTKSSTNSFDNKGKTPLELQIDKITNTVLLEPLRALRDESYFYREKQYLSTALDNSTQKDIFFSCDEFKKNLLKILQTDYSSDFIAESWQRIEVEKLSMALAKEQCAYVYTLRANFLADLQYVLNSSETKDAFLNNTKPVVEDYAKNILEASDYYIDVLNKVLVPYKKMRQIFYPLEKAGYGTYFLEQNGFKNLNKAVAPALEGKTLDEYKTNQILDKAQEEEKVLFVFLKKYESLAQTNGECIRQFFPGLREKWYDFMYEIEQMPAAKRQAYADKRFSQANDGLKAKCSSLLNKAKKQNTVQIPQEQTQQEINTYNDYQDYNSTEEEEVYDF